MTFLELLEEAKAQKERAVATARCEVERLEKELADYQKALDYFYSKKVA
jgi:chromosome condensin MukBEF ATPase and DNA-binding subunit MukB